MLVEGLAGNRTCDDHAGPDADADLQWRGRSRVLPIQNAYDPEGDPNGAFRVILVSGRVTKISEDAVADKACDETFKSNDDF
jgi:hypothetical protein